VISHFTVTDQVVGSVEQSRQVDDNCTSSKSKTLHSVGFRYYVCDVWLSLNLNKVSCVVV